MKYEEEVEMGPRESAEFYIPLVKEYAEKLGAICQRANALVYHASQTGNANQYSPEAAHIIEHFECLEPVVRQLMHRSSSILDVANIGPDLELSLALRQEELETHFRMAPVLLKNLEASFGGKAIRKLIEKTRVKVLS